MANQAEPARVVLEGVPRVSFEVIEPGRDVETTPFPACLRACLEYLGEDYGYIETEFDGQIWRSSRLYAHLIGACGAAFRLSWRPGWHEDNVEIMYMSDEPGAPFERAFRAAGYEYEILFPQEEGDNEAYFRRRIIESIRDRSRPVLGFGVVGPPECCIIAGYDAGGDVLIGWSFFQHIPLFNAGVEFEPSGYFRKRAWFPDTQTPILIGDKAERPPPGEVYRDALAWALKVVRTPVVSAYLNADRHNGLAAYDAWAEHLTHDDELTTDDMGALFGRFSVHDSAVGTVAEGRWYAHLFLKEIAGHEPGMAEELLAAAACYRAEHDLMWDNWNLLGGLGQTEAHVRKFADPELRRRMASIIRRARDQDAEAAGLIERALAK
ncbi:MAG: hypothetical protein JXB47_16450 [Anaerolineae bacterium]|nr:hypothetical protein [Anaerolineae bacterium]